MHASDGIVLLLCIMNLAPRRWIVAVILVLILIIIGIYLVFRVIGIYLVLPVIGGALKHVADFLSHLH